MKFLHNSFIVHLTFACVWYSELLFSLRASCQDHVSQPNIVVLMSDDQDLMLGSMEVMHYTRDHIISPGATFTNAFTTSPICCPSRSSFLTGIYSHNHNVLTNNENCSSPMWQRTHETRTFAAYLNNSGYSTGYFGKYLNEYDGSYIPPGWQYWMGLLKNTKYYNYTLRHNDRKEQHRDNYEKDYLTDLIVNRSMSYFRRCKQENPQKPILSMLSFPAPHGLEDGAPQYQHLYENVTSHITPSFDYGPNPDKHWIISQMKVPMDETQHRFSAMLQRKRLQTLRSVDDGVAKFISMLEEIGELDNTYILYTSDHGFHIGQFGLAKGKAMPYDFDIRVPFYLRGPGIPAGLRLKDIVLNIDIAPTILGIAGVEIPEWMDGRNFMPLIKNRKAVSPPWRDTFLIERGKIPYEKVHLTKPTFPSRKESIAEMCRRDEYRHPCVRGQTWTCTMEGETLMVRKCNKFQQNVSKHSKKKKCACPNKKASPQFPLKCQRRLNQLTRKKIHLFRRQAGLESKNRWKMVLSELSLNLGLPNVESPPRSRHLKKTLRVHPLNTRTALVNHGNVSQSWEFALTPQCKMVMPGYVFKCKKGLKASQRAYWYSAIQAERTKLKIMETIRNCMTSQRKALAKCKCFSKSAGVKPTTHTRSTTQNKKNSTHPFKLISQNVREAHNRLMEEYREKKMEFKERKRLNLGRKMPKRIHNGTSTKRCSAQRVNCFRLSRDRWTTPPVWDGEDRCYCTNSNNNTYWCVRIINETSNLLYCQFVTGFVEYYDMNKDPHQLFNTNAELSPSTHEALNEELSRLRVCKGSTECHITRPSSMSSDSPVNVSSSKADIGPSLVASSSQLVEPVMQTSTVANSMFDLPTNYPPGTNIKAVRKSKRYRKNRRLISIDGQSVHQRNRSGGRSCQDLKRIPQMQMYNLCKARNRRDRNKRIFNN